MPARGDKYTFYEPATGGSIFGICGTGDDYQVNIQTSANPSFELFQVPPETDPEYWPELAGLADAFNRAFETRARLLLAQKRKQTGEEKLELTVHLADDGMRLIYANPAKAKHGSPIRRGTIGKARTR